MKCVILVAGHGTLLESEIRHHGPRNLVGIPNHFYLESEQKRFWIHGGNCLNQKHIFTDVFLVTNADKYKVANSKNETNKTVPLFKARADKN